MCFGFVKKRNKFDKFSARLTEEKKREDSNKIRN